MKTSNMAGIFLKMKCELNSKVVSSCALLSFAVLMAPAHAAEYTYSFSNVQGVGAVDGTVSGVITLPDGDGTFTNLSDISSLTVTSSPDLGRTLPLEIIQGNASVLAQKFVVSGGAIDKVNSFIAVQGAANAYAFALNYQAFGSLLNQAGSNDASSGVRDGVGSPTLTYGGGATPVPAPLPILGAGAALGWSRKLRRRIKDVQVQEV